jgi:hypothetical protein
MDMEGYFMKIQHAVCLILILFSVNLSGQVRGTVIDASTGQPIQYASVFMKGQDKGASTDLKGFFRLDQVGINTPLIVSSIGYETLEFISKEKSRIELVPKVYRLPEIKVVPKKHKLKLTIDPLKKIKYKSFISPAGEYPWILTKFFGYRQEYKSTPFIKQIQIMTLCHLDSATFNVRVIAAGSNGDPGNDILDKNLIISAKKGEELTAVNLSDLNISFPENGLYIAFEWLIVDQNKSQNLQLQRSSYAPMIGIVPDDNNSEIWMYSKGGWYKSKLFYNPGQTKTGQIAVELTLTN